MIIIYVDYCANICIIYRIEQALARKIMKTHQSLLTTVLLVAAACSAPTGIETPSSDARAFDPVERLMPNMSDIASLEIAIDQSVHRLMSEEHIPGAAVVVVKDGNTIFARGYGVEDVRTDRPVDIDRTIFRIGSVSKVMTTWAVTRLADQGKISLDDEVADYVTEFNGIPNTSGSDNPVRIRHLITHTGGFDQIGIGRHVREFELSLDERLALRPSLSEFLSDGNLRRTSPPGQHYRYDTYGITLAGAVLENATGLEYGDAMKEVLFDPAGMAQTYVALAPESRANLARGHGYVGDKILPTPYEVYVTQPASSIDATPADIGRLLEVMTSNQESLAGNLFSSEAKRAMLSPQFRPHPDFPGNTHGMNEDIVTDGYPIRSISHGGSMLGFQTSFTIVPELGLGVFIAVNRNHEAGGERVSLNAKVQKTILDEIYIGEGSKPSLVPTANIERDLNEYEGDYYYGVFCRTCTPKEFERGAWPKSTPTSVIAINGGLQIRDRIYYPVDDSGVFIRSDGARRVYFARNNKGVVSTFSYDSSPDVFERIDG